MAAALRRSASPMGSGVCGVGATSMRKTGEGEINRGATGACVCEKVVGLEGMGEE